jgi:hypothetical protein
MKESGDCYWRSSSRARTSISSAKSRNRCAVCGLVTSAASRRHLKTCSCIATSVWRFRNIVISGPWRPSIPLYSEGHPHCAELTQWTSICSFPTASFWIAGIRFRHASPPGQMVSSPFRQEPACRHCPRLFVEAVPKCNEDRAAIVGQADRRPAWALTHRAGPPAKSKSRRSLSRN